MAIFPDTSSIKPLIGTVRKSPVENVRRNVAEAGDTQIRDVWGRVKFTETFDMDLGLDDAETVDDFYNTNRATTFDYFDYDPSKFSNEEIGTGDGATTTFTIPAKETSDHTIQVSDGAGGWITYGLGSASVSYGSGAVGQDRVVFTAPNTPPTGRTVRVTYKGRHHYECEFQGPPQTVVVSSTGRKVISVAIMEAF
jgi:hypothetical protein